MRVLFYIEPLVFRDNPGLLNIWIEWIAGMIQHASGQVQFGLVSNSFLCDSLKGHVGSALTHSTIVSQADALEDFNFDSKAYLRDLFRPVAEPVVNQRLVARLEEARQTFGPDFVISFSQNRYLPRSFAGSQCLFFELGPLPRLFTPSTLFVDPAGHQTESLLNTALPKLLEHPLPEATEQALHALWLEFIENPTWAHADALRIGDQLKAHSGGRKLALIALQPPDWLTYEGTHEAIDPQYVLMRCLARLPPDWAACVTYHPAHRLPAAVEKQIVEAWPQVFFLDSEGQGGSSEKALPFVDAVVTISSAVGIQAALWGKALVALGRGSNLSALGADRVEALPTLEGLPLPKRLRLFAFLTHRYLIRHDAVTSGDQFLEQWLSGFLDGRLSVEEYLAIDRWDPVRARALLQGPVPAQPEELRTAYETRIAGLWVRYRAEIAQSVQRVAQLEAQLSQLGEERQQALEALQKAQAELSALRSSASMRLVERVKRIPGVYASYLWARRP